MDLIRKEGDGDGECAAMAGFEGLSVSVSLFLFLFLCVLYSTPLIHIHYTYMQRDKRNREDRQTDRGSLLWSVVNDQVASWSIPVQTSVNHNQSYVCMWR